MPAYPHIEKYHADLERFIEFGGSDNEQSIRRAFAECLDSYCRDHREKLALVDELSVSASNRPDGTVKDSLRMDWGYWEAKDSHDDLDADIEAKFNRDARHYKDTWYASSTLPIYPAEGTGKTQGPQASPEGNSEGTSQTRPTPG